MAAICLFCASSERIAALEKQLAEDVGRELARRGHTLVSGGSRTSSMGAVARAARAGGAHTIGVIPNALLAYEIADGDAHELIIVDGMRSRKAAMDERAHAFLVLPGGLGTLEELLEIWVSRSLGMHAKPLVVLDPRGLYEPLQKQLELFIEHGFSHPEVRGAIRWTRTVRESFDALEAELAAPRRLNPSAKEILEAAPSDLAN